MKAVSFYGNPELALRLHNRSDSNLERVQVELKIATSLHVFDSDVVAEVEDPDPPRAPEKGPLPSSLLRPLPVSFPTALGPDPEVEMSSDATVIRFDPVHLRPRQAVVLPRFHAVVADGHNRHTVDVTWSATATSHQGVAAGELDLTVAGATCQPDYGAIRRLLLGDGDN